MANTIPENIKKKSDTLTNHSPVIPGYGLMEEFTKNGYKTMVEATRNSNSLPQDRDWNFYNTHQSFRNLMVDGGDAILHLINGILKEQGLLENIKNRDLEEKVEVIVEANDTILERVANHLDELSGIRKNPELPIEMQTVSAVLPISGSWNKINDGQILVNCSAQLISKAPNAINLLTGKNIQRCQKFFKDRIENSNKTPWEPRITEKPNSLKPLAIFLEETDDDLGVIFSHPYEFELDRFEANSDQLRYIPATKPKALSDTPLRMVENTEALHALVEDLRKYTEIAVDLEHHSYRTFLGFTCLMQISTGDTDYLIDTLALRDQLHVLNEIFTKPTVVKVFHGADSDIDWLQRDLSLYIVNMFDTYQAAKQLCYPHLSLAYLLKKFCQIDANKHFQLADWRMRPLPDELKLYAREDTHYLIYIYHLMRLELLDKGNRNSHILKSVIQASTNVCKKRYRKPVLHEDSHLVLYRRCKKMFDNRQMFALKTLYKWRDETARNEDESIGYVLPNHMLLQISELLPREMQGILACCNPIPPLVRANLLELHKIVLKAREQSVVKPILSEETRSRGTIQNTFKTDTILNCPHDLSKSEEFRDDLPTLLGGQLSIIQPQSDHYLNQMKPTLSVFESLDHSVCELNQNSNIRRKLQKMKFLGPYERYKLVKPFVQAEEEKKETIPPERTDQDRITALQQHFKSVASTKLQIVAIDTEKPTTLSLNQIKSNNRKRKASEGNDSTEAIDKTKRKRNRRNKSAKKNEAEQSANSGNTNKTPDISSNTEQNKKNRKRKKKQTANDNQQTLNYNQEQTKNNQQQKQQKKKRKKNNDTFQPFDYTAVDFNQFSGGAGSANKPKDVRSNFKSRGSKNRKFDHIGKTNVRSGTFSGNRGRGGIK